MSPHLPKSESCNLSYLVRRASACFVTACFFAGQALPYGPPNLPSGGTFSAGAGTISNSGSGLIVNQSTLRGIIDWNSFSIAKSASVNFNNGSGATLNLVNGGGMSSILGSVFSTGSVYLINPQGVLIGRSARINTNGDFVSSTLAPLRQAFLSRGSLLFAGDSQASVVNLGNIFSSNGSVFLIGHAVTNRGSITAPNGSVGLGAGNAVLLKDSTGDQRVFVQAAGGDLANTGSIAAAQAELKTKGGNIYALAGNHTGQIDATGTASINGQVWLVAEGGTTQIGGAISARNVNGTGGAIETSGATVRDVGAVIHTGNGGSWLLDPDDLTIDSALANTIVGTLNGGTDVTEQTSAPTSGGNGDIIVAAPVSWSSNQTLTLDAYHGVTVDAPITSSGVSGGLTIKTNDGGNGGNFTVNSPVTLAASGALNINNASYTLINSASDLQTLGSGNYAVNGDIDLSSIGAPLPYFPGTLEGLGHSLNNLNVFSYFLAGLFGQIGYGTIENFSLSGTVNSNGGMYAGLLTGYLNGRVFNVKGSGTVNSGTNGDRVGGLVGEIAGGTIANSSSSVAVVAGDNSYLVGGLVGVSFSGAISNSFATGNVTAGAGSQDIGGLIGANYGAIMDSYASGSVNVGSSSYEVGGFAGHNSGTIQNSYSTGLITAPAGGSIGGFAGAGSGVTSSYWDTTTSGITSDSSGATGLTTLQWFTQGPAVDSNSGWDFTNTWVSGFPYPVLKTSPYIVAMLNGSQIYGGSPSYAVVSALNQIGQDASAAVTGTPQGVLPSPAINVGSYALGGIGQTAPGYQLTYNGSLTISPLALTVIGTSAANKTYDGTTMATISGGSVGGVINGDTVSLAQAGSFSDKNAGTGKTVNYSDSLTGAGAGNYTLSNGTGTTTADITPLALTPGGITVAGNKVYDGTATATLSGGLISGVLNGDAVSLLQAGSFSDKNAGVGKTVNYSDSLAGASAGNYTLSQNTGTTTGNITPLALTLAGTTSAASKVYDGTTAASLSGGSITGLLGGDAVSLTQAGSFIDKNAGVNKVVSYTSSLTGLNAANYLLANPSGVTAANITPAPLLFVADSASVFSGAAFPAFSGTATGFVAGEIPGSGATGTLVFSTPATTVSAAGIYAINGGLSPTNGNYTFVQAAGNATALTVKFRTSPAAPDVVSRIDAAPPASPSALTRTAPPPLELVTNAFQTTAAQFTPNAANSSLEVVPQPLNQWAGDLRLQSDAIDSLVAAAKAGAIAYTGNAPSAPADLSTPGGLMLTSSIFLIDGQQWFSLNGTSYRIDSVGENGDVTVNHEVVGKMLSQRGVALKGMAVKESK